MSQMQFVFEGLDELKAALRALPADLTAEAAHIVEGHANQAYLQIKTVYQAHRRSGLLAKMLTIAERKEKPDSYAVVIRSNDPIAWIFDNGSQARHWLRGNNKSTGTMWGKTPMPPLHIFSGTMARERRGMWIDLKELLIRKGITVTGNA
jgi:hypothetical protein